MSSPAAVPTRLVIYPTGDRTTWLAHEPVSQQLLHFDGKSIWPFEHVDATTAATIAAEVRDQWDLATAIVNDHVGGQRLLERVDFNNWRSALIAARDRFRADGVLFGARAASRPIGTLISMHTDEIAERLERDADCGRGHSDHLIILLRMPAGLDHAGRLYHFSPERRAVVPPDPVLLLAP